MAALEDLIPDAGKHRYLFTLKGLVVLVQNFSDRPWLRPSDGSLSGMLTLSESMGSNKAALLGPIFADKSSYVQGSSWFSVGWSPVVEMEPSSSSLPFLPSPCACYCTPPPPFCVVLFSTLPRVDFALLACGLFDASAML